MPDTSKVDPGRETTGNPFDRDAGRYGLDYHRDRESDLGRQAPSGTVAARPGDHIVCMSNGGFGGIHERLLKALAA